VCGRVRSTIPHQTSIVLDFVILVRLFNSSTPGRTGAIDAPWSAYIGKMYGYVLHRPLTACLF